jgi:photosystem II stability/assembly factor-like uncharacterized protein
MTGTADRALFMGTDHALYRARPGPDGRWRAEGIALAGLGGVRCLVIDDDDPKRWWACTAARGVLRTPDEGITWQDTNEGITRPDGWWLARHAGTGDLWYGSGPVSVFRSDDDGDSWTPCEAIETLPDRVEWDEPQPPYVGHVRHISLGVSGLVLAAVERGWLLRSDDGGTTWTNVRDGIDQDCHSTMCPPGNLNTVIATTGRGIFRSEDGGRSFTPSGAGLHHPYVTQLVVHPDRPEVLFTAASDGDPSAWARHPEGANAAFYRSDDCGHSWLRLTGGLPEVMRPAPICVAGDPGDPESFFVGMIDGTVWLSEDGGQSFEIAVEGIQGAVRHLLVTRR